VVAPNAGNGSLLQQVESFVGEQAIVDKIAGAEDLVAAKLVDPAKSGLERMDVAVDV
jgi:hypothetical protein